MIPTAKDDHEQPSWRRLTKAPTNAEVDLCVAAAERIGGGRSRPDPFCRSRTIYFYHGDDRRQASTCSCGQALMLVLPYETERKHAGFARVCIRCDAANHFPVLN